MRSRRSAAPQRPERREPRGQRQQHDRRPAQVAGQPRVAIDAIGAAHRRRWRDAGSFLRRDEGGEQRQRHRRRKRQRDLSPPERWRGGCRRDVERGHRG